MARGAVSDQLPRITSARARKRASRKSRAASGSERHRLTRRGCGRVVPLGHHLPGEIARQSVGHQREAGRVGGLSVETDTATLSLKCNRSAVARPWPFSKNASVPPLPCSPKVHPAPRLNHLLRDRLRCSEASFSKWTLSPLTVRGPSCLPSPPLVASP